MTLSHLLDVQDGYLLRGARVIVPPPPPPVQKQLIEELHAGHPGIARIKTLARRFVWWPNIDCDLEECVRSCSACQQTRNLPPSTPLNVWGWPKLPWSRIHVDYAGPFRGHMFLVLVDSHSKWLDVRKVSSATSRMTIDTLRSIFSCHGLPEMMVTDNGSTYTSEEFQESRNQTCYLNPLPPSYKLVSGTCSANIQRFHEEVFRRLLRTTFGSIFISISNYPTLFNWSFTSRTADGLSVALTLGPRSFPNLLPG